MLKYRTLRILVWLVILTNIPIDQLYNRDEDHEAWGPLPSSLGQLDLWFNVQTSECSCLGTLEQ